MDSFEHIYDRSLCALSVKLIPPPIVVPQNHDNNDASKESCSLTFEQLFERHETIGFVFTGQNCPSHSNFTAQLRGLLEKINGDSPGLENVSNASSSQSSLTEKTTKSKKLVRLFRTKNSPGALRRIFSSSGNNNKKEKHQRKTSDEESGSVESWENLKLRLGIVLISLDVNMQQFYETLADSAGFWLFPVDALKQRACLLRMSGVRHAAPSLLLVDTANRRIITTDARRAIVDDPAATMFPWWPPSPADVFAGGVVRNRGTDETRDLAALRPAVLGLLFAANWCPPCRSFVRHLASVYRSVRAARRGGDTFEIVFCSSDRSVESYDQFCAQMPWFALPHADERIRQLSKLYNVHGIPSLLLLDRDNRVITRHGKDAALGDPKGLEFPWGPKPMYELTEHTLCRLKDGPSLVIFSDGSKEDIDFSISLLRNVLKTSTGPFTPRRSTKSLPSIRPKSDLENSNAQTNGNEIEMENGVVTNGNAVDDEKCENHEMQSPLQCFYTGADVLCDQMLQSLQLDDAPLPLACIIDVLAGELYICAEDDISEQIVSDFAARYIADQLQPTRQLDSILAAAAGGRASLVGSMDAVEHAAAAILHHDKNDNANGANLPTTVL